MPDIVKPLFNPNLLAAHCAALSPCLGSTERAIVERWARHAADPRFLAETERSTQAQFLIDIFGGLLGYTLAAGNLDNHNLKVETASRETGGGRTPDARLGFYGDGRDFTRAVIELKAPGADLDAKQSGHGNITAVDQAFGYLGRFDDCRWAIVSNFLVVRLYSKKRGQGYAHDFRLADLADQTVLRQFLCLLHRDRLLALPPANSAVDELLAHTASTEQAITHRFYAFYSDLRQRLFEHLVQANPAPADADPAAHEVWLLAAAQKILDRVLFICFCEDTGLLPHDIIQRAFAATRSGFVVTSRWQQLCGLFQAVDRGSPPMGIPGYNGGIFRPDERLDALAVPDEALADCLGLSRYDFHTEVNVNILGHIFEQSIGDLEAMRARIRGEAVDQRQSKRKQEGVFYTPEYITRYIVEHTVGAWLEERFAELERRHAPEAIPEQHRGRKQAARLALWEEYQRVLGGVKVLDPACGSGAFLIAAFDYLHAEYRRVNDRLAELRGGQPELFDLDRLILQQNLYGVDLNPESVEITKLSLWLKTARPDRPLNDLDGNIKCGNSLVAPHPDLPAELAEHAFDWQAEFPQVFGSTPEVRRRQTTTAEDCRLQDGASPSPAGPPAALENQQSALENRHSKIGFHCVIGNPPYIRQEWLAPYKPGFQREFACYSGTADAYLYFFERGLSVLEPGGRLGFITSGSFNNANFAAPFRHWLPTVGRFTQVVNFGENQPFEDAEMVYPTISIIRKRSAPVSGYRGNGVSESELSHTPTPPHPDTPLPFRFYFMRDKIPESIPEAVAADGIDCDDTVFAQAEWRFQPAPVTALFNRLMNTGKPLGEVVGGRIYYGVKTGLNEAFLVDQATRDRLIAEDPGCAVILKKLLRGQDLRPWYQQDSRQWLITMPCGWTRNQTNAGTEEGAWAWLNAAHPSVAVHLAPFAEPARKRCDQGEFWWELRSCDYYPAFDEPKILWPDIAKLPRFSWDEGGAYVNDTGFIMVPQGKWLTAFLQSHLIWFALSQLATPLRLRGGLWQCRCKSQFISRLPIPDVPESDREQLAEFANQATATARERYALHEQVRHRIATDLDDGTHPLNQKLTTWYDLDFRGFRNEIQKAFKSDIPLSDRADWEHALADWKSQHQALTAQLIATETAINTRVDALFNLTPTERQTLEEHMAKAMINYPLGEV